MNGGQSRRQFLHGTLTAAAVLAAGRLARRHRLPVRQGMPPGLTLGADGTITGTPTTRGIYQFTVTATDAAGVTAAAPLSITVHAA